MGRTVGIDLGTTNSVVSFIDGSKVEVIPNTLGSTLTPSVVHYKSAEEIVVGELAKRQAVAEPRRVVRSIKRIVGKRFADLTPEEIDELPYRTAALDDGMAAVVLDDDVMLRPEEVSADILENLRKSAEDFLGEEVDSAVITVPAHFNDQQRTATKAAAEMIGLTVRRIVNEPTAAALAYGFGQERSGSVAVFDFGGGTFDVSILQIQRDVFEVLSTNGDNRLGGDDVDQRIQQEICDRIIQQTGIDATQDLTAVQRIREASEKAKCELSTLNSTTISLPFIVADSSGPKHFSMELTRQEFNDMMEPLFQRLFVPFRRALEDAHLNVRELGDVLLVGGSTRIPRVQEMVRDFFGREPNRSVNPDEAISAGAAIQGAVISGAIREVLLLDVTPLTLGIELAGGVFKPLIQRNSTIPCEAGRKFTTVVDNQTTVLVHVLQGERLKATENHSLARFKLTGIPPAPKELAEIEVHFSIDANGILSVSAVDLSTGTQTGVVVENYGEIGSRRNDIQRLIAGAESAHDEDARFLRFAERRAKSERLQERANKVISAAADIITEEHLKALKENMLRLDLAIESMDEQRMTQIEDKIESIVIDYENNADVARALAGAMGGELDPSMSSASRASIPRLPTDTHFDADEVAGNLAGHRRGAPHQAPSRGGIHTPFPGQRTPAPASPSQVEEPEFEFVQDVAGAMPPAPEPAPPAPAPVAPPTAAPPRTATLRPARKPIDDDDDDFDPGAFAPPPKA